jgi:aspartyl-tRNA(Asn)/glutamyl-tRNA(Gln) amidotransferase subunit A
VAAEPEHNEDRTEARPDAPPIGLQIVGDHFQEALLLWIAATYEKETKFNTKRPSVFFTG